MKPYKAREYQAALLKKGFTLDRKTDDLLYYFHYEGKKTSIHTKVSMGKGEELRSTLLGKIKGQLRLDTSAQLSQFIECPLDLAAYIALLKGKQII